jgi:hypothetical protein
VVDLPWDPSEWSWIMVDGLSFHSLVIQQKEVIEGTRPIARKPNPLYPSYISLDLMINNVTH